MSDLGAGLEPEEIGAIHLRYGLGQREAASFARIDLTVDVQALARAPLAVPPIASPRVGTLQTCAPCVSVVKQPGEGRAPLLPRLAEASQAPWQIKSRRRARIVVGLAASLLAHAALAALVWRTPTPAPQPGLVELTIVYAGDALEQPAGETSFDPKTEAPAALAQELVEQELAAPERTASEAPQAKTALASAPQQELAMLPPLQVQKEADRPPVMPQEPAAPQVVIALPPQPKPQREQSVKHPFPAQRVAAQPRALKAHPNGRATAESRGAQTSALAPPHYLTAVFARVQQAKRYPAKAQARGDQGRAVVSISIRRNGALAEARLVRSSGSSLLDEATLEVMRRAAPFPPLPPDVAGSVLVLSVPMNFTIE